ncbi:hypothetical protein QJS10_CPB20g01159 [Acorus calamus]|uniref:Uncharacterized protein n=1 Tax=Acorus calamus TaxID=4465 RepID=A0AAV9CCJ6_ACOCL|nr:hypothetical protein QJS10_CPB20g01159 [Acorus calamus]
MDFHSLTRRELQSLCKKNKIPANMTNVAMAEALQALQIVEGIDDIGRSAEIQTPRKPEATGAEALPRKTSARRRSTAADETPRKSNPEPLPMPELPRTSCRRTSALRTRQGVSGAEAAQSGVPKTPATRNARKVSNGDASAGGGTTVTRRSTRLLKKKGLLGEEIDGSSLLVPKTTGLFQHSENNEQESSSPKVANVEKPIEGSEQEVLSVEKLTQDFEIIIDFGENLPSEEPIGKIDLNINNSEGREEPTNDKTEEKEEAVQAFIEVPVVVTDATGGAEVPVVENLIECSDGDHAEVLIPIEGSNSNGDPIRVEGDKLIGNFNGEFMEVEVENGVESTDEDEKKPVETSDEMGELAKAELALKEGDSASNDISISHSYEAPVTGEDKATENFNGGSMEVEVENGVEGTDEEPIEDEKKPVESLDEMDELVEAEGEDKLLEGLNGSYEAPLIGEDNLVEDLNGESVEVEIVNHMEGSDEEPIQDEKKALDPLSVDDELSVVDAGLQSFPPEVHDGEVIGLLRRMSLNSKRVTTPIKFKNGEFDFGGGDDDKENLDNVSKAVIEGTKLVVVKELNSKVELQNMSLRKLKELYKQKINEQKETQYKREERTALKALNN